MEKPPICPLTMRVEPTGFSLTSCQQEACAWWDEDAQCCAVSVLAKTLKKRK